MLPGFWKKSEEKKRRRALLEEETNRDGHWYRDFSVRQESWPLIEHWASEFGYRLVAMKGKRRLYQKGDESSLYQTLVDFRHEENRVVISCWITVSFKMRVFTLFRIPQELQVEPQGGWKGIRARRDACRDLNPLLVRFRQPEIVGSQGFHLTDIDLSTLFLAAILFIPLHAFFIASLLKLQLRPGLSNILLMQVGNKTQTLLIAASFFLLVHHFGILRFLRQAWAKTVSVTTLSLLFSLLTVFIVTRTRTEMAVARVMHNCVMSFEEKTCASELKSLSAKERETLSAHVLLFQQQLANRPSAPAPHSIIH